MKITRSWVRLVLGLFPLAAAVSWIFNELPVQAKVAGFALFAIVAVAFLVEGLTSNYWVEFLGAAGILCFMFGPDMFLWGALLLGPMVLLWTARAWGKLQRTIGGVKVGKEGNDG